MADHVPCGATLPNDVGAFVEHLAACPETGPELGAWCRAIVSAVKVSAALVETPTVSPAVSRDTAETQVAATVPDIEELAVLRDGGMSYRDLANVARVAPETVRRRLARHAERSES